LGKINLKYYGNSHNRPPGRHPAKNKLIINKERRNNKPASRGGKKT
jgi:hypothetical protein